MLNLTLRFPRQGYLAPFFKGDNTLFGELLHAFKIGLTCVGKGGGVMGVRGGEDHMLGGMLGGGSAACTG